MSNSHISAKTLDTDTILQIFADTSEHTQQGDKEGYCIVREHHALAITRKLFTAMEGVNIATAQPAAEVIETDCRSEEGVTVGLIDALIAICRPLATRDLATPATCAALEDLRSDSDALAIFLGLPPAPVVPEGYVLVPIKPTIEMVEAGYEEGIGKPDRSGHARVIEQYDAMLAAAPAQGQQVEWRTIAVMLEQANAGLAQLNGKLRIELAALKAQQVGQEPQRCQCCGCLATESEHRGCLRAAAPQPAPSQDVAGLASSDPVAKAEFETRLRKEFESRWPKPKGVTWGAGINDYCVSEFAEGIALSYPDMWMAYKAGAMRTNQ